MIYFSSDYHFFHNKPFIYEDRGFFSVEEMNKFIVDQHNFFVRPQDDVYLLGDILLGGADNFEKGIELLNNLNGHIHLVRGNHDIDKRWHAYQNNCLWDIVEAENSIYLKYSKYHFYLSHYASLTSNHDNDKPLRQRLINLCGHNHTTNPFNDWDKSLIYHVDFDAHHRPISIDEIIADIKIKFFEEAILNKN